MENNIENSNDEIKERIIKEKSQKTVLVVDDEKPIVDILVYNLKKEGYNTLEANDGEEAVRLVIEKKPDLVLLDIMLPKINGFGRNRGRFRIHKLAPYNLCNIKAKRNMISSKSLFRSRLG